MIKSITTCLLWVLKQGWRQNIDRFGKQAGQWGQRWDSEPRGERSQLSDGALNENGWAL